MDNRAQYLKKKYITGKKYIEKNDLVGLNSNSDRKWTNPNFLIKSIRILVEITRILINIIILVKIRILVDVYHS